MKRDDTSQPLPIARRHRFPRAALIGGAMGLMLGGLGLMLVAARTLLLPPDCAGLTAEECAFDLSLARSMVLRQSLFGGALALLGLAVLMLARRPVSGTAE